MPSNTQLFDRYSWTGREADALTGLRHNRAREYDPAIGRWTSEDPIGFAAGDVNLHRYVGNAYTLTTDPSGYVVRTPGTSDVLPSTPAQPGFWGSFWNGFQSGLGKALDELSLTGGFIVNHPADAAIAAGDGFKVSGIAAVNAGIESAAEIADLTPPLPFLPPPSELLPRDANGRVEVFPVPEHERGQIYDIAYDGLYIGIGFLLVTGVGAGISGAKAAAGVGKGVSTTGKSALRPSNISSNPSYLPKTPTGKGAVPPSQRDPKRLFPKEDKSDKLAKNGGQCDQCGVPLDVGSAKGHHIIRHADGGKTILDNLAVVCEKCHKELHK